jgi:FKBP-type peptidyl-prolyl cis-trans isomerase SlpA
MSDSPLRVAADSFLTLHYRLSGPDGAAIVDTFGGQPATLTLGTGELAAALEGYVVGMEEGAEQSFAVPAGAAFGERNPDMLQWVARTMLAQLGDPDEVYSEGDVVQFPAPGGAASSGYAGVVRQVDASRVLFDFNHPLAGQPVKFDVKVLGVL